LERLDPSLGAGVGFFMDTHLPAADDRRVEWMNPHDVKSWLGDLPFSFRELPRGCSHS